MSGSEKINITESDRAKGAIQKINELGLMIEVFIESKPNHKLKIILDDLHTNLHIAKMEISDFITEK